jgi:hypothetical protein
MPARFADEGRFVLSQREKEEPNENSRLGKARTLGVASGAAIMAIVGFSELGWKTATSADA